MRGSSPPKRSVSQAKKSGTVTTEVTSYLTSIGFGPQRVAPAGQRYQPTVAWGPTASPPRGNILPSLCSI